MSVYDTPWIPVYEKKAIPLFKPYSDLVDEDEKPSFRNEPSWSRRGLEEELGEVPEASDALWESVLALWRLKVVQEDGSDSVIYQKHVSAWLVGRLYWTSRCFFC
jgi:hypothetical protein